MHKSQPESGDVGKTTQPDSTDIRPTFSCACSSSPPDLLPNCMSGAHYDKRKTEKVKELDLGGGTP